MEAFLSFGEFQNCSLAFQFYLKGIFGFSCTINNYFLVSSIKFDQIEYVNSV